MYDNKSPLLFRWRHGNQFRLLIDGTAFFSAMLDAIASARRQILLEMYLVESGQITDRFIDALGSATQRGVINHMLRTLHRNCRNGNLSPSRTAYVSWGKGPKRPLRFSKSGDPNIEEAYSTHFLRQKECP